MLWVSTTDSDKLAMMWMHSHYQSVYPYKGIPSVIPPEPPIEYTTYIPTIDSVYEWKIQEQDKQYIAVDKLYKWSVEYFEATERDKECKVSSIYYWEVVDIGDIPQTPPGEAIGLGDSYEYIG